MKVRYIALIAASILISSTANAGLFDSIATSGWEDKKASAKYNLEAYGFDARAIEWIPKDNKDWRCVFVAANKNGGVACYPKAK